MKKHYFRIISFKRGFIKLYVAQKKTRLGWWMSFVCFSDGSKMWSFVLTDPVTSKAQCREYIENFRRSKGWKIEQIDVQYIEN